MLYKENSLKINELCLYTDKFFKIIREFATLARYKINVETGMRFYIAVVNN